MGQLLSTRTDRQPRRAQDSQNVNCQHFSTPVVCQSLYPNLEDYENVTNQCWEASEEYQFPPIYRRNDVYPTTRNTPAVYPTAPQAYTTTRETRNAYPTAWGRAPSPIPTIRKTPDVYPTACGKSPSPIPTVRKTRDAYPTACYREPSPIPTTSKTCDAYPTTRKIPDVYPTACYRAPSPMPTTWKTLYGYPKACCRAPFPIPTTRKTPHVYPMACCREPSPIPTTSITCDAYPTTRKIPDVYPTTGRTPGDASQTKIKVEVERDSCRTVTVCWSETQDQNVRINLYNLTSKSRHGTYQCPAMDMMCCIPTELTRGDQYEVTVHCMTSHRQGGARFRAVFTPSELRTIHEMAKPKGRRPRAQKCHVFYRNKPFSYFTECERNKNNIMAPYLKDNNGDPASIINGQINGLFFATNVDPKTGQLPNWSFFGTKRVVLQPPPCWTHLPIYTLLISTATKRHTT